MKLNQYTILTISLLAVAGLLFTGCGKQVKRNMADSSGTAIEGTPVVKQVITAHKAKPTSSTILFAVNSSSLDEDGKSLLDHYLVWLDQHRKVTLTLEGNCDERGSNELNLALGQRRANSVRSYLTAGGLSSKRVKAVSFGETRPACKDAGYGRPLEEIRNLIGSPKKEVEACWAKNRRVNIVMH